MIRHRGAWVRYGGPITREQLTFAIEHYQVAILQPWERKALAALKSARPDMIVLMYKCLSSTRSYEPGPFFSSGLSYQEANLRGEQLFAHRSDCVTRIEWNRYPSHWQMAVWCDEYHTRWVTNVTRELDGSRWDGVMADNDVFDDYYGLNPPVEGGREIGDLRAALDLLVQKAGEALNNVGKILVPNIAESRREPGRWQRHAAYGGGFEEVWLAHTAEDYFDVPTTLAQMDSVRGPGISIVRTPSDGTNDHRNFTYGLAAFWIFGGGRNGASFTATGHDQYSGTPHIPQLDWDLGEPTTTVRARGNGRFRAFAGGWAAVNFNHRRGASVTFTVPPALLDVDGRPAPARLTLRPHEGVIYRRARTPGDNAARSLTDLEQSQRRTR
ncbi:MAG: hypothetical protein QOI74_2283 [Micromonosporaceae bacterium]|jgi:hypothetical protein|nr:hypothetical protein [Micromonosporaceae bacterium]